ncbi:MAG: hypothetical protein WBZ11_06565 [Candidatus Sulfotelmatobacter sp.]
MSHFLFYWKLDEIAASLAYGYLPHAASGQFNSVTPGDTLWICGSRTQADLLTIGPLLVQEMVGQEEADKRMGGPTFEAEYHAFASPGNTSPTREVSLTSVANRLRFVSRGRPSLDFTKNLGGQLQRIRELTPESAALISELWQLESEREITDYDAIEGDLERFKDLDVERQTTMRREQALLRRVLFGGQSIGECILCGKAFPCSLLVTAHIKPRAACTDAERRDFRNNVAPMCLFGCDALFERRVVIVTDGKIRVTRTLFTHDCPSLLNEIEDRSVPFCTPQRQKYFGSSGLSVGKNGALIKLRDLFS